LKLEALAAANEAGFGFETIGLAITQAEPMPARQTEFTPASEDDDRTERCAVLIDALRQRLGPQSVRCFEPVESHIPERAEILPPLNGEASAWPAMEQPRPLLLLPRAEPAKVTALVPDGPPRRFYWRGETHEVTGAEGPERIAGEWWRQMPLPARPRESGDPDLDSRFRGNERKNVLTRDYYLVEDRCGHRFWLYREGIYGRETAQANWFVHGLFA
jgi:protein ImuB